MNKKVKVALVGHGHLGRWHAQKAEALENSELVSIVEANKSMHAEIQKLYPNAIVTEKLDEVLEKIDAAIIATPTSFHAQKVEELLASKKHIFCEKPLTSNAKELERLRVLRKDFPDVVIQVGHSERCHEVWEKLGPFSHLMNNPSFIRMNRLAPFKGRATDVDVVSDLMIHDIDLLLWLFPDKPQSVRAWGEKMRTDHWDFAHADFYYDKGRKASLTVGRNHTDEIREVEVIGRSGTLKIDLFKNSYLFADAKALDESSFVTSEQYQKRDHLIIEQENFYRSILDGTPPMVSFEQGASAVECVDAVLKSLEGKGEVSLNYEHTEER